MMKINKRFDPVPFWDDHTTQSYRAKYLKIG